MGKLNNKKRFICYILFFLILTGCQNNIGQSNSLPNKSSEIESQFAEKDDSNIKKEDLPLEEIRSPESIITESSIRNSIDKICKSFRSYEISDFDEKSESKLYIENQAKQYGYIFEEQSFDIYDLTFDSYSPSVTPNQYFNTNLATVDVIGRGTNIIVHHSNNTKDKRTLYLTAHYDTFPEMKGLLDNGTGTSVLLEVAKALQNYDGNFNLVFIFFDGEMKLQQGSKYYINTLSNEDKQNIIGCINIDMVGEKNAGDISLRVYGGEENILTYMWKKSVNDQVKIIESGLTDAINFYNAEIPVFTLENSNPNFSLQSQDNESDYIDFQQLVDTARQICQFIMKFDFNYYTVLLDGIIDTKSNLNFDDIYDIKNFSLKNIKTKIYKNGFLYTTECIYTDEIGNEVIVSMYPPFFFRDLNYSSFEKIEVEGNTKILYHIEYNKDNINAIIFKEDSIYIELSGIKNEIDYQQLIKLLSDAIINSDYIP